MVYDSLSSKVLNFELVRFFGQRDKALCGSESA